MFGHSVPRDSRGLTPVRNPGCHCAAIAAWLALPALLPLFATRSLPAVPAPPALLALPALQYLLCPLGLLCFFCLLYKFPIDRLCWLLVSHWSMVGIHNYPDEMYPPLLIMLSHHWAYSTRPRDPTHSRSSMSDGMFQFHVMNAVVFAIGVTHGRSRLCKQEVPIQIPEMSRRLF